jgi:hypothetical protein
MSKPAIVARQRRKSKRMPLELIDVTAKAQRQATVEILREGRTAAKLDEVADNALTFAGGMLEVVLDKLPPESPVACQEGCSWCCVIIVQTTIPEVLRIARQLHQTLTEADLLDLRRRINDVLAERQQGRRAPCPLLRDDRCSVYPVRPLNCWGWNSHDARRCQTFAETGRGTTPVYLPEKELAIGVSRGLVQGLGQVRLSGQKVELLRALKVALEMPDAEERYLAGERIFAPARWEPAFVESDRLAG